MNSEHKPSHQVLQLQSGVSDLYAKITKLENDTVSDDFHGVMTPYIKFLKNRHLGPYDGPRRGQFLEMKLITSNGFPTPYGVDMANICQTAKIGYALQASSE